MRVLIQALSQQGGSHLCRAGRFFPTSDPLEIEVLDQEEDPPPVSVMVPNGTTGKMQAETRPDPVRMGQASYRAVKADKRMRIVEEGGVNAAVADAQVQAARAEVQRLSGELADARVENAKLGAEVERLTKALAEASKPTPPAAQPAQQAAGRAPAAPAPAPAPAVAAAAATANVTAPSSPPAMAVPLPAPTVQAGAPPPADAGKETPPAA